MFKIEIKEKYQPTVELHDINGTAARQLIEFIYTGTLAINSKNVLDLLSTDLKSKSYVSIFFNL